MNMCGAGDETERSSLNYEEGRRDSQLGLEIEKKINKVCSSSAGAAGEDGRPAQSILCFFSQPTQRNMSPEASAKDVRSYIL